MQKRIISRFLKLASVTTAGIVFGSGCIVLDLVNSLIGSGLAGLDISSIISGLLGSVLGASG